MDSELNSNKEDESCYDNVEHVEMDMGQSDDEEFVEQTQNESRDGNSKVDTNNDDDTNGVDNDAENHQQQHEDSNADATPNPQHQRYAESRIDDQEDVKISQTIDDSTNIIQVTNIPPDATQEHLSTLFGILGEIVNLVMYQTNSINNNNNDNVSSQNSKNHDANDGEFKVCFIEYAKPSSVLVAQHLTNTVFIDRVLIVLPYKRHKQIPDRDTALADLSGSIMSLITHYNPGVSSHVVTGPGGVQLIATIDPRLTAMNLPQYPQLPLNTDPTRLEEIRRTLYIGNLDSNLPPDQVLKFFNDMGEIKYIRLAGSRSLKINHSNNAIVKQQPKIEIIDDSVSRNSNRERQISPQEFGSSRDRHHSSRYDSRSSDRRDRQRDRDRYRRVSPSRSRRSRSRDRDLSSRSRRSRSRENRASGRRSKSGDRHSSREKSARRRSRSRDSRRKRSRSNERTRSGRSHKSSSRRSTDVLD